MRDLSRTSKFKRDLKRELKTDLGLESILREVVTLLIEGKALPHKYRDHPLAGEWRDHRDCHIRPDLVLIYKSDNAEIILVRLGSHSELF